jgi:hypothetical protein
MVAALSNIVIVYLILVTATAACAGAHAANIVKSGYSAQAPGPSGTLAAPEDTLDDCALYGTKGPSSRECCESVTLAVPSLALE